MFRHHSGEDAGNYGTQEEERGDVNAQNFPADAMLRCVKRHVIPLNRLKSITSMSPSGRGLEIMFLGTDPYFARVSSLPSPTRAVNLRYDCVSAREFLS